MKTDMAILLELKKLNRLLGKLGVQPEPKKESGVSVASVTRNTVTGQVFVNDADSDVPRQLDHEQRKALDFMDGRTHGRARPGRRVERQPVDERSGRVR